MPEFSNPFSGMMADRKLSKQELIRAIRYSISAEYEAIQLYMQLAESIDDKMSIKVLKDIADEERVHAGEFLRLLNYLSSDEMELYKEGANEVDEILENVVIKKKSGQSEDKSEKEDLPFCRNAASAEQAGWRHDDEPCDDGRSGDLIK
ncbi:MAG: rubrerythrin [Deltaproteobacteria bacterium]|nr:rubrerythrin [Deltaproteobacteria bacterium]